MAKEEKKEHKPVAEPRKVFFPRLALLFGLFLIVKAVNDYLGWYKYPSLVDQIVLLIAGLWLIKLGLEIGVTHRRKEILKRYL